MMQYFIENSDECNLKGKARRGIIQLVFIPRRQLIAVRQAYLSLHSSIRLVMTSYPVRFLVLLPDLGGRPA